ncbi:holocytochrome c synthase [Peltigera leucophlebia]|nr:holocytochrome c synthase [Peltigera leucophlebia]
MGFFWADPPSRRDLHPILSSNANPPPSCPMHNAIPSRSSQSPSSLPGSCTSSDLNTPITSPKQPSRTSSKLNPLNWMPFELSQSRATDQRTHLPLERTISSIPRGDSDSNWEYPSPQQMYNAMLRKGFDDTPEDDVESMVAVHNFLNEGAWHEIEAWEERFSRGLSHGWQMCSMGEEESERRRASSTVAATDEQANLKPKLIRFQGRPNEITPKARMWAFMGKIYPSKFACDPPFDRHDWYVQRQTPDGTVREIRYVIDYYSAPPEPTGEPVFYLDVRPAVDGPTAAAERMMRWGGNVWHRASGARARENSNNSSST